VPLFLLLFFGYKLIMPSKMIRYEKMTFERGTIPKINEPTRRGNWLERVVGFLT
jgi:hypothetical protein